MHSLLNNDLFDHVPTLDNQVLKTFLSKQAANEKARKTLDIWKVNKALGETTRNPLLEGLFVGQSCNARGVVQKILTVNFDDGRSVGNGIIS